MYNCKSTMYQLLFFPFLFLFFLKCKYDFCWICLEEWKKHSSSTGGYYRCTRYEVIQHVEEQSKEMTVEVTNECVCVKNSTKAAIFYEG